ncbi:MAG TPA: ABC transporter substrate-binding protein, partial [Alphaproteobacteria bacterium]|nr:ABC transporter substrate-binding protein [Alphaproteobacteria bacterium]
MLGRAFRAALIGLVSLAIPTAARADPYQINLGLQQTGTAQWEITAMQDLGIDKKHNLEINIRPLATDQAGQVALQTGTVDVILTDFVWVSLQRHQGNMVTIVPHSLAVGGLMTDPNGKITSVEDLKGQSIAASGTPVDKSWVILQAYYGKLTGGNLADDATVKFGAPPLIAQLLNSGQAAAALNFWSWNAKEQAAGKVELISVPEMLKGLGVETTPPLLGWAFMDSTAASKPDAI